VADAEADATQNAAVLAAMGRCASSVSFMLRYKAALRVVLGLRAAAEASGVEASAASEVIHLPSASSTASEASGSKIERMYDQAKRRVAAVVGASSRATNATK